MFGSVTPEQDTLLHDREQLHSKACILMRVITLIGTVTLAAAILFRSPSDLRMGVFIIVSVAAPTLAVRSPLNWQVRLDTALPASSGRIYVVPAGSVFPLHLHIRDGASGFFRGFANNPFGRSTSRWVLKHPTNNIVTNRH